MMTSLAEKPSFSSESPAPAMWNVRSGCRLLSSPGCSRLSLSASKARCQATVTSCLEARSIDLSYAPSTAGFFTQESFQKRKP